jgi:osomolarity two-component system response regulator SKN7
MVSYSLGWIFSIIINVITGMNDVLPKPFTKEGMLRALEKHLPQFKKNAQFPPSSMPHAGGFVTPGPTHPPLGLNVGQLSAAQSLKEEASPGKSPATATSWQSPNQLQGASPIGAPSNYMQQQMGDNRPYTMTPTHPHPQSSFPAQQTQGSMGNPRTAPHRRVMSDMTGGAPEDHSEKRQRMYPPHQGAFPQ